MTDSEKNAVIEFKLLLARIVIDLDDEKLLEIIKASLKGADDNGQETIDNKESL